MSCSQRVIIHIKLSPPLHICPASPPFAEGKRSTETQFTTTTYIYDLLFRACVRLPPSVPTSASCHLTPSRHSSFVYRTHRRHRARTLPFRISEKNAGRHYHIPVTANLPLHFHSIVAATFPKLQEHHLTSSGQEFQLQLIFWDLPPLESCYTFKKFFDAYAGLLAVLPPI